MFRLPYLFIAFAVALGVHVLIAKAWLSDDKPAKVILVEHSHKLSLRSESVSLVEERKSAAPALPENVKEVVNPPPEKLVKNPLPKPAVNKTGQSKPIIKKTDKMISPISNPLLASSAWNESMPVYPDKAEDHDGIEAAREAMRASKPVSHSESDDLRRKQVSADYLQVVSGLLQKYKQYPSIAVRRRQEGVVALSFTVQSNGQVIAQSIHSSSGFEILDRMVLSMLKKASPLPPFPQEMDQNPLTLIVPVEFYLR